MECEWLNMVRVIYSPGHQKPDASCCVISLNGHDVVVDIYDICCTSIYEQRLKQLQLANQDNVGIEDPINKERCVLLIYF
jgi:hypothetical protein